MKRDKRSLILMLAVCGTDEGTIGSPLSLAHSVYRTGSVTNGGNTYYMGALTATKNSLRMAYRTNFASLNDGAGQYDNKYTGDWEITSIP
ncbi:MAG: hypothetical protein IMZ50_15725, partial [Candidatus Atribacteria bacterium]|nr:hypothetical protein [Candidatus Atribacteria bacterium]